MEQGRNRRRRPPSRSSQARRRPPADRESTARAPREGQAQSERPPRKPSAKRPARKPTPRRRRYSGSVAFRLVTMLVLVLAVLVGVAIFFKVDTIEVTGNSLYRAEEVVEASGVSVGDNLLTLSKGAIAGRINAVLPYVEQVRVERQLPDTVRIHLTESKAVYMVTAADGAEWLMSGAGRLLERAETSAADYPKITGITPKAPAPGAQVDCDQPDSLAAALELMALLEETDYISQIAEVNVEKPYDMIVWYNTLFEIHLGGTEELSYKMQYLAAILEDPQVAEGGVIDLTLQEKSVAIFKPWNE